MSALHFRDLFHPWKIWQAGFRAGITSILKNQCEVAHDASPHPAPTQHTVVPAYNPTRIKGMAREMRTPHITLPPFYAYMRTRGVPLALATQVPAPEQSAPEKVPDDSCLNSQPLVSQPLVPSPLDVRSALLGVAQEDCVPNLAEEKDEDPTENVRALMVLRNCEHKKGA